jgi:predicted metal-dependent phosphoesterase TrpH
MSRPGKSSAIGHVDLHCHSTASDGTLTPGALVERALNAGLSVIALTDHDTVEGIVEAQSAAAGTGLEVIPGIELSSDSGSAELHILGYFIDSDSKPLNDHIRWCREKRVERIEKICRRLTELGLPVSVEDVLALSGSGSVGRPHVARVMIALGYVDSVGEAFNRYIADGQPGFVPRENVPPARAIAAINLAYGVAVLAHPLFTPGYQQVLPTLRSEGLAGLEAYYGEYDQSTRQRIAAVARQHGLIATGGSDYHGDRYKEGRALGSVVVPPSAVDALRAAAIRERAH